MAKENAKLKITVVRKRDLCGKSKRKRFRLRFQFWSQQPAHGVRILNEIMIQLRHTIDLALDLFT